jgi:hypothetical protein
MRDFTLAIYKKLIIELLGSGYEFVTFAEFIRNQSTKKKWIVLRHDVDRKPLRSLRMAVLERNLGIEGTYYFRVIKNDFPDEAIKRIAELGHEIGYHYDDLNVSHGDPEKALDSFNKNLAQLRTMAPVVTVCMHGSPLSRFDNRDLWKKYDYHHHGIIGEPYFDINFNEVLYLTDTGRRWDGEKVSVRDKVIGSGGEVMGKREDGRRRTEDRGQKKKDNRRLVRNLPAIQLHSTGDIISALKKNFLPDQIMLTLHPQRWTDDYLAWIKELLWQRAKNLIKWLKIRGMEKKSRN